MIAWWHPPYFAQSWDVDWRVCGRGVDEDGNGTVWFGLDWLTGMLVLSLGGNT